MGSHVFPAALASERGDEGADADALTALDASVAQCRVQLEAMQSMAGGAACRHRWLVEHFGQRYEPLARDSGAGNTTSNTNGCGACDVCLQEVRMANDSTTVAEPVEATL